MARGGGRKRLFFGKDDHGSFLHWLEQEWGRHGWRVHAWVMMGNPLREVVRGDSRTSPPATIFRPPA